MVRKTIMVDIDNTLVDQVPRKKQILSELGHTDVTEETLREDFDLQSVLGSGGLTRATFMKDLLGPGFQESLVAFPRSVDALNELKNEYNIVYFSIRPKDQEEVTIHLLQRLGFPSIDGDKVVIALWPIEDNIGTLEEGQIKQQSSEWKCQFASEYVCHKPVLAAISDTPEDVSIFASLGIPSILFNSHGNPDELRSQVAQIIQSEFISESIRFISTWEEIPDIIRTLDKSEVELLQLVATHTTEYTSFLRDLDAKTRLLLVIATFLGASFFGISWHAFPQFASSTLYKILGVSAGFGLIFSLLAMVFSIRAFSSRHTRGSAAGEVISLKGWRMFFDILRGQEVRPGGSPVEEAEAARQGKGPTGRLAHLAFFQHHYGTYDPILIRNRRMLDMRALNYQKIYPEVWARRMLIAGLVLVFVCFIVMILIFLL